MAELRAVSDQSGWCRHSKFHHLCHGQWTTPSSIVTCDCECHRQVAVKKVVQKPELEKQPVNKVLTKGTGTGNPVVKKVLTKE